MIGILICAISILALLQFFFSYSHSLIAESRGYELSEQAREISGVSLHTVRGDQFQRLLQLLAACPEPFGDTNQILALSTYFSMLGLIRFLLSWAAPAASQWIEAERNGCAYLAAVTLDRRIAHTRTLVSQQACR